jgi:hypothetical protein
MIYQLSISCTQLGSEFSIFFTSEKPKNTWRVFLQSNKQGTLFNKASHESTEKTNSQANISTAPRTVLLVNLDFRGSHKTTKCENEPSLQNI